MRVVLKYQWQSVCMLMVLQGRGRVDAGEGLLLLLLDVSMPMKACYYCYSYYCIVFAYESLS